jgi:hypothetical protein
LTKVASTTLSGYVDMTAGWSFDGAANMSGSSLSVWHHDFSTTDARFTAPVNIVVVPEPSVASLAAIGATLLLLGKPRGTVSRRNAAAQHRPIVQPQASDHVNPKA